MKAILEQYFIKFGQLDLVSFGSLKWQKKGASFADEGLEAPKESIHFEPISSTPTKHFYVYLGEALSISTEQAAIQYEQFIQNIFDGNQDTIAFESLGHFSFNNGILNWQSQFSNNLFYSSVEFAKITSSNTIEQLDVEEKDNWILFASIIAIISLVAILFKFYH
jgi:hypothetical protein